MHLSADPHQSSPQTTHIRGSLEELGEPGVTTMQTQSKLPSTSGSEPSWDPDCHGKSHLNPPAGVFCPSLHTHTRAHTWMHMCAQVLHRCSSVHRNTRTASTHVCSPHSHTMHMHTCMHMYAHVQHTHTRTWQQGVQLLSVPRSAPAITERALFRILINSCSIQGPSFLCAPTPPAMVWSGPRPSALDSVDAEE